MQIRWTEIVSIVHIYLNVEDGKIIKGDTEINSNNQTHFVL